MAYIESLLLVTVIGFLIYKWSTSTFGFWKERGIPYKEPSPLIGSFSWKLLYGKTSALHETIETYMEFKDNIVYGIYNGRDPALVVRDLELIKKIGIRDFDSFPNHKNMFDSGTKDMFSRSVVSLRDQKWKEMRNILTPSFTGNKMRQMFQLINECCMQGVNYIEEEVKASGKSELDIEMKDYFTRYTNDVIASAAFGIKVNSFKDKTNEFYSLGGPLAQFRGWTMVKLFLFGIIPTIMKALRIELIDKDQIEFFKKLLTDAMKYRKEHNIIRPDMIQLLMEAKSNLEQTKSKLTDEQTQFDDDDFLAQCFIFFMAGFETTSTCLCFTLYELMMNTEIQQRLYEEVQETDKVLNGNPLDYDTLMRMKYMDMVISESLRKWPPVVLFERECAADYKLTDNDDNLVVEIKKNESIFIPIMGLHHDPAFFDNPESFNPERFSDANKHQIKSMSYLPFGVGPRACIGNRFALMEVKALIYHILLKFSVVSGEKTPQHIMDDIRGFQLQPSQFWMKFVPRVQK